jgi:predicted amidohydrolase
MTSGTPLPSTSLPGGVAGPPQGSQPLLGGSVIASFDGAALDARGTYVVQVRESGKDVAKATVDLSRFRCGRKERK